ncbi:NADH oxidoreductase, partial [Klebsiella pneumoniae]
SEYITLTVRRIDEGTGSQWLTREVKRGDYLWLSDAMGEFTCDDKAEDKFLLLAAGCGVTPIMAMRRWLAKYRPQADVQVIYNVRSPEDVIFAEEWRNYPVTLVAEHNATHGFVAGRLTRELLQSVPDLASRTVMTCGPAPYMEKVEQDVAALGVTRFFKEKFFTPVAEAATSGLKFTKLQPAREFYAPVGTTLLDALESNKVPVTVACRAGVCGCCKTKVVSGKYSVTSTMTLTDAEIADGYVLACSCHPQSDLVLA